MKIKYQSPDKINNTNKQMKKAEILLILTLNNNRSMLFVIVDQKKINVEETEIFTPKSRYKP